MARGNTINEINFSCQQNKCLTQHLHAPLHLAADAIVGQGSMDESGTAVISLRDLRPGAAAASDQPPTTERERLIWALEQCGWVQAKAARVLNISPRQMGYALQKYNIEVKKF